MRPPVHHNSTSFWRLALALILGLTVTALASCGGGNPFKGPQGETGATGVAGTAGTNGATGAAGMSALMNLTTVAPGPQCPAGGTEVQSGLDTNGDGILEPGEITETRYVCNGATGAAASFPWINVTGTSAQTESNTGYVANNASNQVVFTLPPSASMTFGDVVWVRGLGAGGWTIAQNDGQSVNTTGLGINTNIATGWSSGGSVTNTWASLTSWNNGQNLLAGTKGTGVFASSDNGTSWAELNNMPGTSFNMLSASASGSLVIGVDPSGYIYSSTDGGQNWSAQTNSVPNTAWVSSAVSADGSHALVGQTGFSGNLYLSTNAASQANATWTQLTPPNGNWNALAISSNGTYMLAAGTNNLLWLSTTGGSSWVALNNSDPSPSGLPYGPGTSAPAWSALAISADGNYMAAADQGGGVWMSNNFGTNWTHSNLNVGATLLAMSADGKTLASVAGGNIVTSSDGGITWSQLTAAGNKNWVALSLSQDGKHLAAAVINYVNPDYIYTAHVATSAGVASTTVGPNGSISGGANDALELQYLGSDVFSVLSGYGTFVIQ